MTPTLSPDQQEHYKLAQRQAYLNAQTFSIFASLVQSGHDPQEALTRAEAAMEVWSVYEDAHHIDPPPTPSTTDIMKGATNDMVDTLKRALARREKRDR